MHEPLETDYLVVGTGAAGMAFTDALLSHSDATVTLVDRRHAPGGHWIDAYPFVRLHQPSAFYGVSSAPLGVGTVDRSGLHAGFHEQAGADELRAYYGHVMDRHFLPTGRVHYHPCSDHAIGPDGRHLIASRLTGAVQEVRVRRKWVDTGYLEGRIPATSPPPFAVDDGVRCVAAGDITRLAEPPERVVVIGSGKTALDTCVWLLSHGVTASAIQWVRPREGWWLNRRFNQPGEGLPDFFAGVGLQFKAMAQATSVDDLFARLEADGYFLRVDTTVTPTMSRGAMVSEAELALLRQIGDVVRRGHVRRIARDRIVFDGGSVPTSPGTLHVHCAAVGLARPPLRPIFETDRVTLQPLFWGFACFPAALLGVIEATIADTGEKKRLCPPIRYWDEPRDYLSSYLALMAHERARAAYPTVAAWAKGTRLNPMSGLGAHRQHPLVAQTWSELKQYGAAAAGNLVRLLA
ncbi:NAD(P)-binding protein [Rubrivivax sp. RP6-9]|uniref:NAD(P)-binding protein n=1 Tax=Rubrivivax sp. RP6-9 TaxID=3415750 RepID=UPI003CC67F11